MNGVTNNDRGFTLVELIIVVAIIGVLAAIAVPSLSSYRVRTYNTGAVTDVRGAKSALEIYYSDHLQYP